MALQALNIAFFVFHTGLVFFNLLGWAWKPTRRWNLLTLLATAFSWFVMGAWRGVGYCLCTDWHWQVRKALGYQDTAQTYIQLVVKELVGVEPSVRLAEALTAGGFALAVVASVALNLRDHRRSRQSSTGNAAPVASS